MNMTAPVRELSLLFADVSGSTRIYERLGDTEAKRAIEHCLAHMEHATATSGGRVIKHIGDEIMAAFDTAEAAMTAASEMQQSIDTLPAVSGLKRFIRVGFHHGPAIEENNDIFGDTVNTAARIVALAKPGQILASAAAVANLSPILRACARELVAQNVKGKSEEIRIFEIVWRTNEDLTMATVRSGHTDAPTQPLRLRLQHGERELVLDSLTPSVTLGRDQHNDLVIGDPRASRNHASIERRRDKFVLIDQSTNGTYVTPEGEAEVLLKHDSYTLKGRGIIVFGHSHMQESGENVSYESL